MLRSGNENDEGVKASPSTSRPRWRRDITVSRGKWDGSECEFFGVFRGDRNECGCFPGEREGLLKKLCDFWREGRYVDFALTFDDGKQLSCHRAILASSSSYFDTLFSNDWTETKNGEIHLKGDSSQWFCLALEFIYTGKCKFDHDEIFEVLLLANKYDIKELQYSLLEYLWRMGYRFDYSDNFWSQRFEMWMKVWIFCQDYSVVAESLVIDLKDALEPFKKHAAKSLERYASLTTVDEMASSKALDFDYQGIFDFLNDPELDEPFRDDYNDDCISFKIASAWLKKQFSQQNPGIIDGTDEMNQFDSLLACLRLDRVSLEQIHTTWSKHSFYKRRILALRERQNFLIIPDVGETGETVGFVCHQIETEENFCLDLPTSKRSSVQFHGDPKLSVVWPEKLLCIRGTQEGDRILSHSRYAYSLFEGCWVEYDRRCNNNTNIGPVFAVSGAILLRVAI